MGENFEKIKVIVKTAAKQTIKPLIITIAIVAIVVVILAGTEYLIKKDDASHKDNDWSNTPYAAAQYSNDVNISPEGEITTNMTAQELWDKMIESGSRVDEYLDSPEDLLKLMNAQNVTNFLDTREDPDKPIDWKELNKAVDEKKIQGIVKLKRAGTDGNAITMTYVSPEKMQELIDEYNKTGSEEARKEALKYFTIQKGTGIIGNSSPGSIGSVNKTRKVESFRKNPQIGDYIEVPPNTEEKKAKNGGHDRDRYVHEDKSETDGLAKNSYSRRKQINNMVTSNQYGMKVVSTYPNVYMVATAQKFGNDGDVVAFELSNGKIVLTCQGDDKGNGGHGYGQDITDEWGHWYGGNIIEFFEGEGFSSSKFTQMLQNEFGISSDEHSGVNVVCATYLGNVLDGTYTGGSGESESTQTSSETSKTKSNTDKISEKESSGSSKSREDVDEISEVDNTQSTTNSSVNETSESSSGSQESPFTKYNFTEAQLKAVATVCQAEQGSTKGAAAEASLMANHMDLNKGKAGNYPDTGEGLYNYVKNSGWFSKAKSYMDTYKAHGEALRDDVLNAVKEVLVEGKRTIPGYVDEHDCFFDIKALDGKDTGLSKVQSAKVRAKSCPEWVKDRTIYQSKSSIIKNVYGSTYVFVCFPTDKSDPFGSTLSADKRAQIGDFCYDFDSGVGSGSTGTTGSLSSSAYYAVVATWSESYSEVKSNDPEVAGSESPITYSMTTENLDYQNAIKAYQMPFDYLWALTVISGEKDFTLELAELVEDSEIEITVYDSLTATTTVDVSKYTKKEKVTTKDIELELEINTETSSSHRALGPYDGGTGERTIGSYTITSTTINKNNTLEIVVTKANVWTVDYEQEYTYEGPQTETTTSDTDISEDYSSEPDEIDSEDTLKIAENLRKKRENAYKNRYPDYDIDVDIIDLTSEHYYAQTGTKTITTTTESSKYVSSPATTTEKTDKNSSEPNFVSILSKFKHLEAKGNILSGADWLFEVLEENSNTADMVDLTKYLLYKASGSVFDSITEFDFEGLFKPGSFTTVSGIYGGTIQEKIWFALKDLGFNDVAVAAAMGNIDYESGGIKPSAVEGGYNEDNGGIGICQWTNNKRGANGRNTQLKKYAQSKGVTWQDEDTQIEFLITELTGSGPASGYADYQFMASSGYYGESFAKESWKNVQDDESQIEYATKAFAATFERPGKDAFNKSMSERVQRAKKYYNEFKGKQRSVGQYSADEISAGVIGSYTSGSGKKFTLFIQGGNAPWSGNDYGNSHNMAKAGCGPTALAIIASAYNNSITPETARAATVKRYGLGNNSSASNMQQVLRDVGVNVPSTVGGRNKQQVINCLKNGGQVWIVVINCKYTGSSHCMALLDYDASNDTVYVAHGSANYRPYGWDSLDYVMNNLKSSHQLLFVGG